MSYLPWVLFGVSALLLMPSFYFNWKFANIILNMQDSVEEALEVLDEKYNSISKVLETPLFFDSPQVRAVLNDIRTSRDSILIVANKITQLEEDQSGATKESN
jgi:hypothetical protein